MSEFENHFESCSQHVFYAKKKKEVLRQKLAKQINVP